jgi:hypothetical protein
MARTRSGLTILSLLGLVAFLIGHDLVFVATYGPRYLEGLRRTGHDPSWTVIVIGALLIAVGVAVSTGWRLHRLRRLARELERGRVIVASGTRSDLGHRILVRWLLIATIAVAMFVLAENIEHVRAGAAAPGLAVLGSPEYSPFAPLIIAGTAFVVAFLAGLVSWERDSLVARIAAAERRSRLDPDPRVRRPDPRMVWRPGSILGARLAGRAPPIAAAHS